MLLAGLRIIEENMRGAQRIGGVVNQDALLEIMAPSMKRLSLSIVLFHSGIL